MPFQQRLKDFRNNLGLSQKKMAEKLGITQQAYYKYESGKAEPSIGTLLKLQKLGCDLNSLLKGTLIGEETERRNRENNEDYEYTVKFYKEKGIPITGETPILSKPRPSPYEEIFALKRQNEELKNKIENLSSSHNHDDLLKLQGQVEILEHLLKEKDKELADLRGRLQDTGGRATAPAVPAPRIGTQRS